MNEYAKRPNMVPLITNYVALENDPIGEVKSFWRAEVNRNVAAKQF